MAKRADVENAGLLLVQKMFELEQAYRALDEKDRELDILKHRGALSEDGRMIGDTIKLEYQVTRLEEKLKAAHHDLDRTRAHLRDVINQKKELERQAAEHVREKKEMDAKMGALRIKVGVASANYNVGRYETDQLKKKFQEGQIQLARLEERLRASTIELERLRGKGGVEKGGVRTKGRGAPAGKKELIKLRSALEQERLEREEDRDRLTQKEEELRQLSYEMSVLREKMGLLQMNMDALKTKLDEERARNRELEQENNALQEERSKYEDHIQKYKVKLGVTKAGKNVKLRIADDMRKKDEAFNAKMKELEKKLKQAYQEIDRLRMRMMPGKTANSVDNHAVRMRKTPQFSPNTEKHKLARHRSSNNNSPKKGEEIPKTATSS